MKWETKSHPLKCPIDLEIGEGEEAKTVKVEKVSLSTPKGKSLRKILRFTSRAQEGGTDYSEGDMVMDCIQVMSDLPEGAVDELHPADIAALGELAGPFLAVIIGEGATSESLPDGGENTKPA